MPGCSSPTPAESLLACPKVSIIRDVSEVTQFRPGGGQTAQDVLARAAITDYRGNCEYTSKGVTVNLNLFFVAERGGALPSEKASFRYFVAAVPPGETLPSAKTEFDANVSFVGMNTQVNSTEELASHIPMPVDTNARDWNILVGFQLTPEQLAWNREHMKTPGQGG